MHVCVNRLYISKWGICLKTNLQARLDELIRGLDYKPTLLLHSCCAPCSSYVLEYLSGFFNITLFYYNPNIAPEKEYYRRLEEQKRLLSELPQSHGIGMITGEYDSERFLHAVRGFEKEPERGARCEICFRMRLESAAAEAVRGDFEYLSTTLSISPHKDALLLNQILEDCLKNSAVKPLPSDFKKKGGYQRSLALSKIYGLYRQDYCGCVFSRRDA